MAIDPRIPLSSTVTSGASAGDILQTIQQVRDARAQAETRRLAATAAQRAEEASARLRAATTIDPVTQQVRIDYQQLAGHLDPDKIANVQEAAARAARVMKELETSTLGADEKKRAYLGGLAEIVKAGGYDPQLMNEATFIAGTAGALTPKEAEQALAFSPDEAFRKHVIDQAIALAGPPKPPDLAEIQTVQDGVAGTMFAPKVAGAFYPSAPAAPGAGPAIGSFEDYVVRRFGPAPTAAQITEARKAYQQADDRGPDPLLQEVRQLQLDAARRAAEQGGNYTPQQIARFNSIVESYNRSPLVRAADRTLVLQDAVNEVRKDPSNAVKQMALAYGFIQISDTYQSAVREGELQNITALATRLQQLQIEANRIYTTGAFMPPGLAQQIATTSEQMIKAISAGRQQKLREYQARARVSGVGDMWDVFATEAGIGAPGADTRTAPAGAPTGPGGLSYQDYLNRKK